MRLHEYRVLFIAVIGIIVLLVSSPALSRLLVFPRTEFFTEFWILDSNHRADAYPFNVISQTNYNVFLGIGNRLGHSAYYLVEVKFRNQTQSGPDSFNRTSSSLPSLFSIPVFVADEGTWELPVTFSFDYARNQNLSRVDFDSLTLNGVTLGLKGSMISLDSTRNVFLGDLFFELWLYNMTSQSFWFHNRFVGIWLNATG
jgi:hypothetical protein